MENLQKNQIEDLEMEANKNERLKENLKNSQNENEKLKANLELEVNKNIEISKEVENFNENKKKFNLDELEKVKELNLKNQEYLLKIGSLNKIIEELKLSNKKLEEISDVN